MNKLNYLFLLIATLLFSCSGNKNTTTEGNSDSLQAELEETNFSVGTVLTEEEKSQGWTLLFDGVSMANWRGFQLNDTANSGWLIEGGSLTTPGGKGDLITKDQYENFELSLEWKISPQANTGIFYNVLEGDHKATYETAPEYAMVDDVNYPYPVSDKQKSGSCFDLYGPSKLMAKPAGEWNTARLLVNKGKVEHWLNGEKVVEYELWTDDWKKIVAATKFSKMPDYGKAKKGHLGLQDHGKQVWFKNIKLRVL